MAPNDDIIEEFKSKFSEMKKDLGFKVSYEELEEIFFFEDYILGSKYVSTKLSRALSARMRDLFNSWSSGFHALLIPSPYSMIQMGDSESLNDDDKKEVTRIMREFTAHVMKNSGIGIRKDKKKEAQYFDDSVALWNRNKEKIAEIQDKIAAHWKELSEMKEDE